MAKNVQQKSLDNLKPFQSMSKEERLKIIKKGIKARIENQKKRKTMREMMNILLALPVSSEENETLKSIGITKKAEQIHGMLVAVGLLKRAETGDPRAVETLCGISGDIFTIPKEQEDETTREEQINQLKEFDIKIVDASKNGGNECTT